MKYSILGFNQEKVINYSKDGLKCDLTDLLILNYIVYAQGNPKMRHLLDDGQPCVWLSHDHILDDLPILNITEGTLKNRLTKLRKMELLASKTVANEGSQGSRTYYRTTSFLYDLLFETTSFLNDVLGEPRHSSVTPDTKVKEDKVKVVSKDTTTGFQFGCQKPKKDNLFTKCVNLVDDYTTDPELRKALIDYLHVRLEIKDKPLYVNSWKGLLNKLDREFDATERLATIRQSIERAYISFYPVRNGYQTKDKPWEKDVSCKSYTEQELEEINKDMKRREERGEKVWF